MQDGARCHIAKNVMAYLDSKKGKLVEDWPAHSPDFNMIESVWADLDRRVSDMMTEPVTTKEQLKVLVQRAWESIPQSVLNNHVDRFHKVMKEARTAL
jgi:hypothetical protein